jgi:hypothetical protein
LWTSYAGGYTLFVKDNKLHYASVMHAIALE